MACSITNPRNILSHKEVVGLIVGMDFGTTNSAMAVYDDGKVRLLPLDPASANPAIARTALYITNEHDISIGREGLDRYFKQNVGRPAKLKKVWVGEVEVYGADMYYVTDVYAWVDILSPGRLFLSIKSGLSDPDYQGTVVGRFYYSLETLVAAYLSITKIRAEKLLGREITGVVLGRPVRFSDDPVSDRLAEARLLEAAQRAGFKNVYFQYEPVAAAHFYASTIDQPQNIMVFDFGGGTLDITIMRIGMRTQHQVLATGGIPIAGDIFDQKLVRAMLPKHFGEGTRYGTSGRQLPMPSWIFDIFSNWQRIIELQTPDNRRLLNEIAQTAEDRPGIKALISLVANNYSLQMFDIVEAAKRKLSDDMAAILHLTGPDFKVVDTITRSGFEQIIASEIQKIDHRIDETVKASGLKPRDIDAVLRTGGSSEIPVFKYMLMEKFGAGKVRKIDTFNSVSAGLGILAHAVTQGTVEATAAGNRGSFHNRGNAPERRVAAASLELLQLRMAAKELNTEASGREKETVLVSLSTIGRLKVSAWPIDAQEPMSSSRSLVDHSSPASFRRRLLVKEDQQLLIISSNYRFLLTTPEKICELARVGMELAEYYQLKDDEFFTTMCRWKSVHGSERLLLVTGQGFARSYPASQMIENIEGPSTYIFDRPLPGHPIEILGSNHNDQLLTFTRSGRVTHYHAAGLPLMGQYVIKLSNGDSICRALLAQPGDEIFLITRSGYCKRMPVSWIRETEKPGNPGTVIIARPDLVDVERLNSSRSLWLVTEKTFLELAVETVPVDNSLTKRSHPLGARGALPFLSLVAEDLEVG